MSSLAILLIVLANLWVIFVFAWLIGRWGVTLEDYER